MSQNSGFPESSEERGKIHNSESTAGGHLPVTSDKVYDLLDIVDELPDNIYELTDIVEEPDPLPKEGPHEVLIIDGRGYKKASQAGKKIYDLFDIVEEKLLGEQPKVFPEDEMMKKIVETVERMAREMIPEITERVVREEIEKLKKEAEEEVH